MSSENQMLQSKTRTHQSCALVIKTGLCDSNYNIPNQLHALQRASVPLGEPHDGLPTLGTIHKYTHARLVPISSTFPCTRAHPRPSDGLPTQPPLISFIRDASMQNATRWITQANALCRSVGAVFISCIIFITRPANASPLNQIPNHTKR